MAVKLFLENILLLKVETFEGFSNRNKTDEMVNNHLSSCNLQLTLKVYESISKASSQFLATSTRQITNPMPLKLFPHTICGVTEH